MESVNVRDESSAEGWSERSRSRGGMFFPDQPLTCDAGEGVLKRASGPLVMCSPRGNQGSQSVCELLNARECMT